MSSAYICITHMVFIIIISLKLESTQKCFLLYHVCFFFYSFILFFQDINSFGSLAHDMVWVFFLNPSLKNRTKILISEYVFFECELIVSTYISIVKALKFIDTLNIFEKKKKNISYFNVVTAALPE